ncbi:glucose-1-phosphate cytidylyltransferase [Bradyrhizobium valentinum]|uniref:Glucose-1-phosphate cytidylyltransferase n=1 Tax=Bradyrhizobium valentinum TaxID=1518501 RepID=A0A0R3M1D3_9BRAD|nr:glucose-1-phosphate cytidylyltransferase [Bradyrhizobium valentinum]KRR03148.1 glucose-1-phosphate cytidylyltransferase [Bradyrhizobium valentinum]KRR14082.1 glucose-1-phosphate cytidylyltransferase [Bradyrhizobium valentinum]
MKVVVFAGGLGTRLSEETAIRPKPMVEIGGRPIIWHIMQCYANYGLSDFVVLGGYKVEFIRQYFLNYRLHSSDFTIDMSNGEILWCVSKGVPWRVTVLDTGLDTMTGGRMKRARNIIGNDTFCLTYGDGVSDVDIGKLIAFHREGGAWATVTTVEPPGRFGVLNFADDGKKIASFREKDGRDVGLVNAGFFVCEPEVFDLIDDDATVWEQAPMRRLVDAGQLRGYHHSGFWQSMDTLRDKQALEDFWAKGNAPWKVWND